MQTRPPIIVLGLMSGTSLDGVDAAFLETDGHSISRFGPSLTLDMPHNNPLEAAVKAALAWGFKGDVPCILSTARHFIDDIHIQAARSLCAKHPDWANDLSLIGFHGQTVLHHPPSEGQNGQTLQLGSGVMLAELLQKPVVFDFRTQDMQHGGQGAPLAPIYHKALITHAGLEEDNVAVLNLGGVGNVTLLSKGRIWASDTGPANGPLNSWMSFRASKTYDAGGRAALMGKPDFCLIDKWMTQSFFNKPFPRSADRYDFDVIGDMAGLSLEDGAASLAAFCAVSVAALLKSLPVKPTKLIVCGGGRHNRALLWMLQAHIDADILTAEDMGWNSDAIEAQAFGYLAVRRLYDLPISFPTTTGVRAAMTGGRLVNPE